MIDQKYGVNIDGSGVIQTKGVRQHNVTSMERAALQTEYANRGVGTGALVYDTDEKRLYSFDGLVFQPFALEVAGDIRIGPGGVISAANAAMVEKVAGYQYAVSAAGMLAAPGVTFLPSGNVDVGDMVLFVSDTEAYVIERNAEQATEELLGLIRIASQAEVNAGVVADEAVTPATLKGYIDPIKAAQAAKDAEQDARILATEEKNLEQDGRLTAVEARVTAVEGRVDAAELRLDEVENKNVEQDGRLNVLEANQTYQHFEVLATLPVGATTITHNLNLSNKDAFVLRVAAEGSDISVDVDSVNANSITLSTLIPFSAVSVFINGK